MECKDCKYYNKYKRMCYVTHLCNTISCNAESYEQIENANICYNCKYWIGGGDWGLICEKDYYNCSANGFDEACEVLIEAAKNIDLFPAYKEIQEMMITELKSNYSKLLENVMMKTMVRGLCDDWSFRSSVELALDQILASRANNSNC